MPPSSMARPPVLRARLRRVLADTGALVRDGARSITPVAARHPPVGAPVVMGCRRSGGVAIAEAAHNSSARLRSARQREARAAVPRKCRVCSRPGRPDYAVVVSGTEPADG